MVGGLSRELVAKALVIAIAAICRKQKRDLYVIAYSHRIAGEWQFPKGVITMEKLQEYIGHFDCGGTDWRAPVERACEITKEGDWKKADLLMISDGDCRIDDETYRLLEKARKRNVQMRAVLVAGSGSDKASLARGCGGAENVAAVSDFADDDATDLMFTI